MKKQITLENIVGVILLAIFFWVVVEVVLGIGHGLFNKQPTPKLDMQCHDRAVDAATRYYRNERATNPDYEPSEEERIAGYDLDDYSRNYHECVRRKGK